MPGRAQAFQEEGVLEREERAVRSYNYEVLDGVFEETLNKLEKIIVGRRMIQKVYPVTVCPNCNLKIKFEFALTRYEMYSNSMRNWLAPVLDGLEVECCCGKGKVKVVGLILSLTRAESIEILTEGHDRENDYRTVIVHIMIPREHGYKVLFFDTKRFKRGPRKGRYKSIQINEERTKFYQAKKLDWNYDFFNFYGTGEARVSG